jgi:hypothetical protein
MGRPAIASFPREGERLGIWQLTPQQLFEFHRLHRLDPENWDDEDVAAVRWMVWLHSQDQATFQAAWLVLRDDQKERISSAVAHAFVHGAHGARSIWACALRAELLLAHPLTSAPLVGHDQYLPAGSTFPPSGNQAFCRWFVIPPNGHGVTPLTTGEAIAIVREFTDHPGQSGPVPRRIGKDNLLIAPLDTIILPVEVAEEDLAELDLDERTWFPEFYYSRSLDTTARVEQAALSWMAVRGDLPASRARTGALESMRRVLLASVAGARFSHRP